MFCGDFFDGRVADRDFDALAEFQRAGLAECDFHAQDACVRGSAGVIGAEAARNDRVGDFLDLGRENGEGGNLRR